MNNSPSTLGCWESSQKGYIMMKPIRKDEQEYLKNYISKKFSSHRSVLETERKMDIDKTVSQNLSKFRKGLPGIEKSIANIKKLDDDYQSFKENMHKLLHEKRQKLIREGEAFEKKMENWKTIRRWNRNVDFVAHASDNNPVNLDEINEYITDVCEEEAIKAYDNSKKGEAIRQLDAQKEEAENALYSGGSLSAVRSYIHDIFSNAGIADNVAKNLLMLSQK